MRASDERVDGEKRKELECRKSESVGLKRKEVEHHRSESVLGFESGGKEDARESKRER